MQLPAFYGNNEGTNVLVRWLHKAAHALFFWLDLFTFFSLNRIFNRVFFFNCDLMIRRLDQRLALSHLHLRGACLQGRFIIILRNLRYSLGIYWHILGHLISSTYLSTLLGQLTWSITGNVEVSLIILFFPY